MPNILSDRELDTLYEDFLNEAYGSVKIAGYEYDTASCLREIDPTAYRCGFNDWLDSEVTEGNIYEKNGEYYDVEPEEETEND